MTNMFIFFWLTGFLTWRLLHCLKIFVSRHVMFCLWDCLSCFQQFIYSIRKQGREPGCKYMKIGRLVIGLPNHWHINWLCHLNLSYNSFCLVTIMLYSDQILPKKWFFHICYIFKQIKLSLWSKCFLIIEFSFKYSLFFVQNHIIWISECTFLFKTQGQKKVASMMESKDIHKGIFHIEWEHKKMEMEMEDLNQKAWDIQMLFFSRERQKVGSPCPTI